MCEKPALFQNIHNEKYRELVSVKEHIESVFSRYSQHFRNDGMTRKEIMELIDRGPDMILNTTLSDHYCSKERNNKYYLIYKNKGYYK